MEEYKDTMKTLAESVIEQARHQARMWFIAWIITLSALVITNMAWLYVFQSYDYVSQDGEGVNNANSGTQGDLTIEPKSKSQEEW